MAEKFKTGDVVKLKSGSPKLTVEDYKKDFLSQEYTSEVICRWFAENSSCQDTYHEDMLELYQE